MPVGAEEVADGDVPVGAGVMVADDVPVGAGVEVDWTQVPFEKFWANYDAKEDPSKMRNRVHCRVWKWRHHNVYAVQDRSSAALETEADTFAKSEAKQFTAHVMTFYDKRVSEGRMHYVD